MTARAFVALLGVRRRRRFHAVGVSQRSRISCVVKEEEEEVGTHYHLYHHHHLYYLYYLYYHYHHFLSIVKMIKMMIVHVHDDDDDDVEEDEIGIMSFCLID